ncbi:NADAR domain-containing protein [Balamuthia mandrillaris]
MDSAEGTSASAPSSSLSSGDLVRISKKLSYVLRHGLPMMEARGAKVYADGWLCLDDLWRHCPAPLFKKVTQEQLLCCVASSKSTRDEQQRFQLEEFDDGRIFIRATYGHSFPLDNRPPLSACGAQPLEQFGTGAQGTAAVVPSLTQQCLSFITANIKRFEALGECLDDSLLCRLLVLLKKENNTARAVMNILLGSQVQTLHLEKTFVSDATFRAVANKCPSLLRLNLKGCFSVCNDQSMMYLLKRCHHLQVLNLARCKYLTDKALEAIAKGACAKRLETLDISGLPLITDKGIAHLQRLSALRSLTVLGCPNVSLSALTQLEESINSNRDSSSSSFSSSPLLKVESDHFEPIFICGPDDVPYGPLSHNALFAFSLEGVSYPSLIHYYQCQKFVGSDDEHAEAIRNAETASKAFRMGQSRDKTMRADWEKVKYDVMWQGMNAKFSQNPQLIKLLLSTGDRLIVERRRNTYWGDGLDGKGHNKSGKLLMQLRKSLASQQT